MLFGRLVRDPEWLAHVAELPATPSSTRSRPRSRAARRAALLDVRPLGARR